MNKTIHRYAIEQVWCSPTQDNSVIIRPARITPRTGAGNVATVMGRQVLLPTTLDRYDVYQVGALYPSILGLNEYNPSYTQEHWISFEQAIRDTDLIVQIYNQQGIEVPKASCYYCLTKERNLIFCVKRIPSLKIAYPENDIYFRFYTNAFFVSDRSDVSSDGTYSKSLAPTTVAQISNFGAETTNYKAKPGYVFCFVNGMLRQDINISTVSVGDVAEFIYDSSIKKVVTFRLNSLQSFTSTLDGEYKYLMAYPHSENDVIDFQDDIDFWVIHKQPSGPLNYHGLYLGRNTPQAIRMVTHREYSIKVYDVQQIKNHLRDLLNLPAVLDENIEIMLVVRKAGFARKLVKDSSRLFELFKLSFQERMAAMIGHNASMSEWNVAALENNSYMLLMREAYEKIDMKLIQNALGYNGVAKLIADSPLKAEVHSSTPSCILAPGVQINSSIIEYDSNGEFLDIVNHLTGERHYSFKPEAAVFEVLSGLNGEDPAVSFSTTSFVLEDEVEFRLYRTVILAGVWQDKWYDVTDSEEYVVDGTNINIVSVDDTVMYMLRTSKKFLCRSFELMPVGGNYFFPLTERVNRGEGFFDHFVAVPPRNIKVFLNKKPLIEKIDFIVKFPNIYIISKKHLVDPFTQVPQDVVVVCHGFCDSDCVYRPEHDLGFIEHGYLSNDNEFDLRDDKVLSIIVGGKFVHPADLLFSEEHSGVSVANALNGTPYQVSTVDVPIWGLDGMDTTEFRRKAKEIDTKVKDFMTQIKPQADRGGLMVIPRRYEVFSPFFQRVIWELINNTISDDIIVNIANDSNILAICAPYEHTLKFDPLAPGNMLDPRYVTVHPHCWPMAVTLSLVRYQFLVNVVRLYGKSLISLTNFVNIST